MACSAAISRRPASIPADASTAITSPPDAARALRDRQGVAAGAGADVQPRLAGSDQVEQDGQGRLVGSGGIRPEQPADRSIEVGPVGDFTKPVHLFVVGPHTRGPGRLQQLDDDPRGCRYPGCRRSLPPSPPERVPDAPRSAGPRPRSPRRLVDQRERRSAEQDRVPTAITRIDRYDDRMNVVGSQRRAVPGSPGPGHVAGPRARSGPPSTSSPNASIPTRSELDRPRAGSGLRTRTFATPVDCGLDRVGIRPENDDHDARRPRRRGGPGHAGAPAGRPGSRATWTPEPGPRPGRQDDAVTVASFMTGR